MKRIKNVDTVAHTFFGQVIQPDEIYIIQEQDDDVACLDLNLEQAILDEKILVGNPDAWIVDTAKALTWLKANRNTNYPFSWAVDMGNEDLSISGTDWTVLPAYNILWDEYNDIDPETSVFHVHKTGIYTWDAQVRVNSFVNVDSVELAVMKILEDESVDYWFIMCQKNPVGNFTQLSGITQFDFRSGERYFLAIRLIGTNPSAVIDGDDDYTAWGASWTSPLVE